MVNGQKIPSSSSSAASTAAFVSWKGRQSSNSHIGHDGSLALSTLRQKYTKVTTTLSNNIRSNSWEEEEEESKSLDERRRSFLAFALATGIALPITSAAANAAPLSFLPKSITSTEKGGSSFLLLSKNSTTATAVSLREPIDIPYKALSAETCLLELLPVKNKAFGYLEKQLQSISRVRSSALDPDIWKDVNQTSANLLLYLDAQRSQLEPVFNQEDSTMQSITKAERGERLIEELRTQIIQLCAATSASNATKTYEVQKKALYTLSQIGELLVPKFPYEVPTQGKYSFLPRLLGRTRITFTVKRNDKYLGNVTVIADGYAAPITAGNFVDLCLRGFYTGLPVKYFKKRLSFLSEESDESGSDASEGADDDDNSSFGTGNIVTALDKIKKGVQSTLADVAAEFEDNTISADDDAETTVLKSIPMLGSFGEGFYDPLTAKPRRIPLEIVRIDRLTGTLKLSYSGSFSADDILSSDQYSSGDNSKTAKLVKVDNYFKNYQPLNNNRPVLSFDIPGLVAWNHPDRQVNGGTAEFFSLPVKDITKETTKIMNRQFAPFGYVLEGLDLMQNLKSGDVIAATDVDKWGEQNLVKIRGTSFADVMQSTGENGDDGDKEEGKK